MTYEQFMFMDYRLVESYVKKHEMDIERETMLNWEQTQNMRMVMMEALSIVFPPKSGKKFEFPKRPESRTNHGINNDERNKMIDFEIKRYFDDLLNKRKSKEE